MPKASIPPRSRSTSKPSARAKDASHRRHPRAARRAAGCRSMSASRSRTGSITCCPGVRAQIALKIFGDDLDALRAHRRSASRSELAGIPGLADLQVEKQVLHPAARNPRRLRPRRALRRAAGSRHRAAQPALERPRRLARRRRLPPLRRRDAAARQAAHHAEAGRSADRDARPAGFRRGRSPTSRRPRVRTRSCARTAGAASWCWPTPTARADMARHRRGDPAK